MDQGGGLEPGRGLIVQKQGRIHGCPSRVLLGRGNKRKHKKSQKKTKMTKMEKKTKFQKEKKKIKKQN